MHGIHYNSRGKTIRPSILKQNKHFLQINKFVLTSFVTYFNILWVAVARNVVFDFLNKINCCKFPNKLNI